MVIHWLHSFYVWGESEHNWCSYYHLIKYGKRERRDDLTIPFQIILLVTEIPYYKLTQSLCSLTIVPLWGLILQNKLLKDIQDSDYNSSFQSIFQYWPETSITTSYLYQLPTTMQLHFKHGCAHTRNKVRINLNILSFMHLGV